MTAQILQLRDYDWLPPRARPLAEGSAVVLILPVIRVERLVAEIVEGPARKRRSLLGEP